MVFAGTTSLPSTLAFNPPMSRRFRPVALTTRSASSVAATVALSWQHFDWLRVTGEMIAMQSRRREYLLDGFPSAALSQQQLQISARFFF